MLECSQLPDTQGASGSEPSQSETSACAWGKLLSTNTCFDSVELNKNQFTFGRSSKCDIVYKGPRVIANTLLTLSKMHFQIVKHTDYIDLEDFSLNGTFVNGTIVGQGNKVFIQDNDEISLSKSDEKAYMFIESCVSDSAKFPREVKEKYVTSRLLGTGSFANVHLIFDKVTTRRYAMKSIYKKECELIGIAYEFNEFNILRQLDHPNIIKVYDTLMTTNSVHLILEFMEGGNLITRLKSEGCFEEPETKFMFIQLVKALSYLHGKNICHRDMKVDNILMAENKKFPLIKIADFGLSKVFSQAPMSTFCGTPSYMAPEILRSGGKRIYTKEVDIWSLGVVLYICLSGHCPFNPEDTLSLNEQIMRGYYFFDDPKWEKCSKEAISLIKSMLHLKPELRLNMGGIKIHPWFQDLEIKNKVKAIIQKRLADSSEENILPNKLQRTN